VGVESPETQMQSQGGLGSRPSLGEEACTRGCADVQGSRCHGREPVASLAALPTVIPPGTGAVPQVTHLAA
jgi:hypothetical protein